MTYRIERRDVDGSGPRPLRVYAVPPRGRDYWAAVTDVPCPACLSGTIRWHEAGSVPGYRVCDGCGRHWLATGTSLAPALILVPRRGGAR